VPREELYQQYLRMCQEEGFESTSRSGFGRIVNQAFPRVRFMSGLSLSLISNS
jgi:hypothetical protein